MKPASAILLQLSRCFFGQSVRSSLATLNNCVTLVHSIWRQSLKIRASTGSAVTGTTGGRIRNHSLYELAELVADRQGVKPYVLNEHYRSDASIIGFFETGPFTAANLWFGRNPRSLRGPDSKQEFFGTIIGALYLPAREARRNPSEGDAIIELIRSWAPRLQANPGVTVGVVTPFRRQMELLESAVLRSNIPPM